MLRNTWENLVKFLIFPNFLGFFYGFLVFFWIFFELLFNYFLFFYFYFFLRFLKKLLRLLLKVTEVTTEHKKWPKVRFMLDYCCIGNSKLKCIIKCMHFWKLMSWFSPWKKGRKKIIKNVFIQTSVMHSMFYSRGTFWLLKKKNTHLWKTILKVIIGCKVKGDNSGKKNILIQHVKIIKQVC